MMIGKVIRTHRKESGLTQKEVARRLGVTTPAVNKWENGNTQPDIALLAPIARLFGISTDTLLSFHDDLTDEEIAHYIREIDNALNETPYKDMFVAVQKKLNEYPNCKQLAWQAAVVLDARRMALDLPDKDEYEDTINEWYSHCLNQDDEKIRNAAAESLFYAHLRKKQYSKAQDYLSYLSNENPERQRLQALIYSETGKKHEAYQAYEQLMFSGYQRLQAVLNDLRILYMADDDHAMAHKLVELEAALAAAFEMGIYHEVSVGLETATWEQNVAQTEQIAKAMLENIETIQAFTQSSLYQHMALKAVDGAFATRLRDDLLHAFKDEEAYGYMKDSELWKSLGAQGATLSSLR